MKYLLFTNPTGGWFPSMTDDKLLQLNLFRTQLADFKEKVAPHTAPDVKDLVEVLEQSLTERRDVMAGEASVHRPGVYQWHEAFNKGKDTGEVRHTMNLAPMDLEKYDIIHINGCGADVDLLPQVKQALGSSSIPVIFNLDYAIENWQQGFAKVDGFFKTLSMADFVFAVEPGQQALLNYCLKQVIRPKRERVNVPVIPHPCDVQRLSANIVPREEQLDRIIICFHRYDKHIYIPACVTWDLEAYHPTVPFKAIRVPVYLANIFGATGLPMHIHFFDGFITGKSWPFWIYELAHSTIGMEYYSIHSHSRYPEEAACLGIPVVGTNLAHSINTLHPYTSHSLLDFGGMRRSLQRLMGDEEFYDKCKNYALEHVKELDHQPSKMKLLFELNRWLVAEGKVK